MKTVTLRSPREGRLFTLEVSLIGGPVTEEFVRRNKSVSRTIQMLGSQTLEDLHHAVFEAFDRIEEHMYEFQFGGRRPGDPNARRYTLLAAGEGLPGDLQTVGNVEETTMDSLGLKDNDVFGYWFDFGDDWWHQVDVVAIEEPVPPGKYPNVTERVGESPPQYAEVDEDEEEDDDFDDDEEFDDEDDEDEDEFDDDEDE